MNLLEARVRDTKSKGDVRSLRLKGNIPAIIYGGGNQNEKISASTKTLKILINNENFLSKEISFTNFNISSLDKIFGLFFIFTYKLGMTMARKRGNWRIF